MSARRATWAALALSMAAASCGQQSIACGDGTYCPADTTCGGAGVCLVDPALCAGSPDGTPCLVDPGRGHCATGACAPGVLVIAATVVYPGRAYVEGIRATLHGHPEVPANETNRNGYFELVDAPRDAAIVIDLERAGAMPTSTRAVQLGHDDLPIDSTYGEIPLVDRGLAAMLATAAGRPLDPRRGIVAGVAFDAVTRQPLPGLTATLTGTDCAGPLYLGADLLPIAGAQATQSSFGGFAFVDCAPGTATLRATRAGAPCTPLAPAPPGDLAIEVEADRIVFTGRVVCP